MRYPCLLLALAALLPAACQPPRQGPVGLVYRCADGRLVQATYGEDHALLVIDRTPYRLAIARSASGARYVGGDWQWWTRGMHDAWLAPLQPGETIASAPGVACQVR
jgi:membrane-bound inhibitor of C-type lysozyme